MKIVIIGPQPPYRGGISHSNFLLCKNLSKKHQVVAVNFSRMFPKILYPGKFQQAGPVQKLGFEEHKILDSINPLSWIGAFRLIQKQNPGQVTFQWWHTFFTPSYFTIALLTKLFTKAKVSMIIQNALPHEAFFLHKWLTKIAFAPVDFFICMSKADQKDVLAIKRSRVHFMKEPSTAEYFTTSGKDFGKLRMRILFFGFVREYKGLSYLLSAMPKVLKKIPELKLDIIGEFWDDKDGYIRQIKSLGISGSLNIEDRYVDDSEVPELFANADAVILPYTSSTQSGIIQLAIGLATPIISTDVGGNKDLIKNRRNGLLVRPKDSDALADAIIEFYGKGYNKKFRSELKKQAKELEWGEQNEELFFDRVK